MRPVLVAAGLALVVGSSAAAQRPAPKKVDIVSVTGCLRLQAPDTWLLVAATEPVVSIANAPPKSEIPTTPPAGKARFQLIGVGEFNLPAHRDKTVVVKGLLITDTLSRLNVTSVVDAVPTCAPGAPPK
ncbi:MAG: hypothetical protein AB1635_20830 [Acidobacteriota bacterium]